ncbi:hypothetical protein BELL_1037g00040 [Botrytis elliptica]|uniref:Uncharacterized protein n=1 Tax=Botrytis elliptica TaxID=278938 RepID=A0A4Z1IST3_9HELO|nr:hypothetical protein BELL_1037g00040 [Botrytis elliptica]
MADLNSSYALPYITVEPQIRKHPEKTKKPNQNPINFLTGDQVDGKELTLDQSFRSPKIINANSNPRSEVQGADCSSTYVDCSISSYSEPKPKVLIKIEFDPDYVLFRTILAFDLLLTFYRVTEKISSDSPTHQLWLLLDKRGPVTPAAGKRIHSPEEESSNKRLRSADASAKAPNPASAPVETNPEGESSSAATPSKIQSLLSSPLIQSTPSDPKGPYTPPNITLIARHIQSSCLDEARDWIPADGDGFESKWAQDHIIFNPKSEPDDASLFPRFRYYFDAAVYALMKAVGPSERWKYAPADFNSHGDILSKRVSVGLPAVSDNLQIIRYDKKPLRGSVPLVLPDVHLPDYVDVDKTNKPDWPAQKFGALDVRPVPATKEKQTNEAVFRRNQQRFKESGLKALSGVPDHDDEPASDEANVQTLTNAIARTGPNPSRPGHSRKASQLSPPSGPPIMASLTSQNKKNSDDVFTNSAVGFGKADTKILKVNLQEAITVIGEIDVLRTTVSKLQNEVQGQNFHLKQTQPAISQPADVRPATQPALLQPADIQADAIQASVHADPKADIRAAMEDDIQPDGTSAENAARAHVSPQREHGGYVDPFRTGSQDTESNPEAANAEQEQSENGESGSSGLLELGRRILGWGR